MKYTVAIRHNGTTLWWGGTTKSWHGDRKKAHIYQSYERAKHAIETHRRQGKWMSAFVVPILPRNEEKNDSDTEV